MVLRWYQAKLAQRPFATQVVTTAVLFGAGDCLAQQAVEKKGLAKHDLMRTVRMAGYGGRKWFMFYVQALAKQLQLSLVLQLRSGINFSPNTSTSVPRPLPR